MFGALLVFGRHIKGMITVNASAGLGVQRDTSPPPLAPLAFYTFMMLLAPVTNWEPHGVLLIG
jgi:capsule polysaccharide modification protein KpsS